MHHPFKPNHKPELTLHCYKKNPKSDRLLKVNQEGLSTDLELVPESPEYDKPAGSYS